MSSGLMTPDKGACKFSLDNPPDEVYMKALTKCIKLRPNVLKLSMLPYDYVDGVMAYIDAAMKIAPAPVNLNSVVDVRTLLT
jgi:hypothetical protein